jgi:transposase
MPQERLSMRKIREVLRLRWEQGLSHRQIATSCRIGQTSSREFVRRANDAGLRWPLPEDLTDAELERRLFPPPEAIPSAERPLPDWDYVHRELRKKGVTLLLLWQEYQEQNRKAFRYSRYCELYHEWRKASEPRMHQVHKAGEKLFVDYAGQTARVVDRTTGEVREAQVFVAALGASSYTFVEATWTQDLGDWTGSHVRAFEYFGGVPELVIPDNIKTGVTAACYYDPDINRTYLEMARHYNTVILPARVRKPRDKAIVENAVQQAERWILAPLRNRTFFSLGDLNAAIRERLDALNERPGPGLPASRRELFNTIEKPALRPLPGQRYEMAEWRKARVNIDYHVQVEYHYYSVPSKLIRKEVEVRLTATTVELFSRCERVASHRRSQKRYGYTTLSEHMPPGHKAYAERDAQKLLQRGRLVGPAVEEFMQKILDSRRHPEQGYRACLGILRLATIHEHKRVEQAARRAIRTGALSYRSMQAILTHRLEDAPLPEYSSEPGSQEGQAAPLRHANIRGAGYYHNDNVDTRNDRNDKEEEPCCHTPR